MSRVCAWVPLTGASCKKEELGANLLLRGLCRQGAKRSPVRDWRGSAAPARPLLQTSSCRGRLSSRAAHACGGEHSLLRLENSSAFCACKILELFCRVHKKSPNHQSRVFSPTSFPLSFPCGTINLPRMAWAGSWSTCSCGVSLRPCPGGCSAQELVERLDRSLGLFIHVPLTCIFLALPSPSGLGGVSMGTDTGWGEAGALVPRLQ